MVSARHITELLQTHGVDDLVRPNFFEVEINRAGNSGARFNAVGQGLGGSNASLNLTQDFIQKIGVPSTSLGEIIIKRMGRKVVMPGEVTHGDNLLMSVHSDDTGHTRDFFQQWINDYSRNVVEGRFNEIHGFLQSTIAVYSLNGNLEKRQKFVFRNVYPKLLGDIEFNHETDDQVLVFTVGFGFSMIQHSKQFGSGFSDLEETVDADPAQEVINDVRDRWRTFAEKNNLR
jgi:hypothetical protein